MFPMMAIAQNSYTLRGKLLEQITETVTNPPIVSTDCDGNVVTIPSDPVVFTRMAQRSFTTITIKVFLGTSDAGTPVKTYSNLTKSQIKWNGQTVSPFTPATAADTGKFEYEMTGIPKSRINYTAFVYLNGGNTASAVYSEEFLLSSVPGIPLGTIWAYMGDGTDLADLEVGGWFLCDGRDIDADLDGNLTEAEQDDLIALFTRSGKHEPGKLPDLRGRFLRGMDKSSGNDPNAGSRTGGNVLGSIQADEFKSHDHTGSTDWEAAHTHGLNMVDTDDGNFSNQPGQHPTGDAVKYNGSDFDISTEAAGGHDHSVTINARGGLETRPKNVYVNYIIKCVK